MDRNFSRVSKAAIVMAAIGLATAAFADNPVSDEKIAVAKASLDRAEQSGAPQSAPVELATARDKLARAQKASLDHDWKPALMLATQADLDARVAEATAQAQRSHQAATEFDASMQALRQESLRSTPPVQTPQTPVQ